jgi:hypothetical protein
MYQPADAFSRLTPSPFSRRDEKKVSPMDSSTGAVPVGDPLQQEPNPAAGHTEARNELPDWASDMPLPREPRTIFQGILCTVAVLGCLYIAQDIIVPVVVAVILKLLLQPLVSLLEKARVLRPVGALIALGVLVMVFVGLGMLLSSRAASWASEFPGPGRSCWTNSHLSGVPLSMCSAHSKRWASTSEGPRLFCPTLWVWLRRYSAAQALFPLMRWRRSSSYFISSCSERRFCVVSSRFYRHSPTSEMRWRSRSMSSAICQRIC